MTTDDALGGAHQAAICVPDNNGRLIGKRIPARRWMEILKHGLPMPDYHLVTGIDNRPYSDLEVTGYRTGFNNGLLRPVVETAFRVPTEPGTMFFLAEAHNAADEPFAEAPRAILRRQVERLKAFGLVASMASELEFYLFRASYGDARAAGYRGVRPYYHRHADNDILTTGFAEPFLDEVRQASEVAGIKVETTQGEGGIGQYEINIHHQPPMAMADRHAVFKHLVKALAQAKGLSASFMAKLDAGDVGSSGHVHVSLQDGHGLPALGAAERLSPTGSAFLAGLLAHTPELVYMHAPYENSYRRFVPGNFAPTKMTWALDNRTAMIRLMGRGDSFRFEFRLPGADMNPYFSFAAILAAGIAGIERKLVPPAPVTGNADESSAPTVPGDLTEALALFANSELAARALSKPVHRHLLGLGIHERDEGRRAVTDWQLARGFEPS